MAIKEKLTDKIPSPSEIAKQVQNKTPQAAPQAAPQMAPQAAPQAASQNTSTQFNQEDIGKIQKLQEDLNQVFFQLGQLKANEIRLKKQEIFLNERLTSLEEQEKTIAKELTDKYGKGSLDIESGTFTPTE